MVQNQVFSVKIGGQAGQGIKSSGQLLAKLAVRSGYHVYDYSEYSSLIRGGHNAIQLVISSVEATAPLKRTDFLIALNQETVDRHGSELTQTSVLLFDEKNKFKLDLLPVGVKVLKMPLSKLSSAAGGGELEANSVALGVVLALLGGELKILNDIIAESFGHDEKEKCVNLESAASGFKFTKENFADSQKSILAVHAAQPRMLVNGNEAVALGAIAAGLKFAAIYPMTPISGLLAVLAKNAEKYGYVFKQPEDEISAVNMAIGASFAGARSLTATSGGGFCLMTEGLGLSAMTETPLVIVEGMRPGPATGLPTWYEQGDLQFVLHAHQGEFPRIVLAAGDGQEAFFLTAQAFNLADKYQLPVILLLDKNICENDQSFEPFNLPTVKIDRGKLELTENSGYRRYAPEKDGVSGRSLPGSGSFFTANSDEHDETGFSTEEAGGRLKQMEKRMSKLTACKQNEMADPRLFGPEDAKTTIVSWGSNKGSILEALKSLEGVNYLHVTWMSPFPAEAVKKVLHKSKRIIDVEANYSGQLAGLIREKTGIEITDRFLKYDGRPFYPEEIIEKMKNYG